MVWKAGYKTFGEAVVDSSSSITNNFRFPGQYYDAETGLHYNYHRYYDPGTGRYVSSDPIYLKDVEGLSGAYLSYIIKANSYSPQDFNNYAYSLNNPLNRFDPFGLQATDKNCEDCYLCGTRLFSYYSSIYSKIKFMRHCVSSCEISKQCPGGTMCASSLGLLYEGRGAIVGGGSRSDLELNRIGRECSTSGDCVTCCKNAAKKQGR